jgi:hypothetical protein
MPAQKRSQEPFDDYPENDGPRPRKGRSADSRIDTEHLNEPPKLHIELVIINGDEGKRLHALQSEAVQDALLWLAEQRRWNNPSKETDT